MRAWLALMFVAVTLGGCDRKAARSEAPAATTRSSAAKRPARPSAPARPQERLTASVDGKARTFQSAFAWMTADGTMRVSLSTAPRSCAEVTSSMIEALPDEALVELFLGKHLAPDGRFEGVVTQTYFDGSTIAGNVAKAEVHGDASVGKSTTVKVELALEGLALGDSPKRKVKLDGTIDALGCPAPKGAAKREPPQPPAQGATLEIAGQKLPIVGVALEQKPDGRDLVLSSGGVSCDGFAHATNAALVVTLHYRAKGDSAWQEDVGGDWIGNQQSDQSFADGKLVAAPSRAPEGAETIELALSGKAKIMDYPVALSGKVTARVCGK